MMRTRPTTVKLLALLSAGATLALTACASSGSSGASGSGASGSGKNIVIAFSQAFSSNSWQAANDKSAQTAANMLKSEGKISKYLFTDADNNVTTQVSQINSLILQHPSVILIDPSSSTGLNGVIAKAVHAGIKILVFTDGPVTSKLPYELEAPLAQYNQQLAQYIVNRLHGKGNVLNVRGVAGTGADQAEESGTAAAFKAAPGIKVVGTVYGEWDEATAESAVARILPGLPKIDAVMQQGGSGYGIAEAFKAAGRPAPLIVEGNRGEELKWWAQQHSASGYTTESIDPNPGMGASAVYIGYALATGQRVPKKNMVMPSLAITQATLGQFSSLTTGQVAYKIYDQAWTQKNVIGG
jgi:ribose transport system substrate-binding protein